MCSACNTGINQARSDQFAEKMFSLLNYGALTIMISIGHRTGLFDAMNEMPPSTSAGIPLPVAHEMDHTRFPDARSACSNAVRCSCASGRSILFATMSCGIAPSARLYAVSSRFTCRYASMGTWPSTPAMSTRCTRSRVRSMCRRNRIPNPRP